MLSKQIKTPMIVGTILYGIAVIIDLCSVFVQKSVFPLYAADIGLYLDELVLPFVTIEHIIVMLMFAVFFLVFLKYKGKSRKAAGIAMIVVYCLIGIISPYISSIFTIISAKFKGADYLAALSALDQFIAATTTPFTVVATVFVIIAIGRYMISSPDNEG